MIRLRGCAGWSSPLLLETREDRFSRVDAHIKYEETIIVSRMIWGSVQTLSMVLNSKNANQTLWIRGLIGRPMPVFHILA